MTDDRGQTTEGSLFRATEPQSLRVAEVGNQRSEGSSSRFQVPGSKFKVRKRYGLKFSV
jgi:hypothetical protein